VVHIEEGAIPLHDVKGDRRLERYTQDKAALRKVTPYLHQESLR
jgi:hypothetical protein